LNAIPVTLRGRLGCLDEMPGLRSAANSVGM
jgi:hypothetical protein